jgi:peptidoglycan/LPS O-acetylase OafA/YrhL
MRRGAKLKRDAPPSPRLTRAACTPQNRRYNAPASVITTTERSHSTEVAKFSHRPALDGLRALAVLAVLAHHGGYLPGGYLGVDLFFVLSGFLITSLMLVEHANARRVDLPAFWGRRARRLLPASWTYIAVVTVADSWAATDSQLATLRKEALGAFFYVENWVQARGNLDYWDRFTRPSLFRHFWSLAIEEQFYILWPLAVGGLIWLTRRRARPTPAVGAHPGGPSGPDEMRLERTLVVLAILGALGSYALGIARFDPATPTTDLYYGTATRVGAILLGVAVAAASRVVQANGPKPRGRPAAAGGPATATATVTATGTATGTATVTATVVLATLWIRLDGTSPALWRGGLALAGICAATLVGAFGSSRPPLGSRALTVRPLVWIGEISYGLYLWHWPVFVLIDEERAGFGGLGLLAVRTALSIGIATISFYVIEQPIRRRTAWNLRLGTGFLLGLGAVAAVATLGSVTWTTRPQAAPIDTASGDSPAATADGLLPPGVTPRILVLGDSVAVNLGEVMERMTEAEEIEVLSDGRIGCPITDGPSRLKLPNGTVIADPGYCDEYEQSWAGQIAEFKPNVVLLIVGSPVDGARDVGGGEWATACEASSRRWFADGLEYGLDQLVDRNIPIVMFTIPYYRGRNSPPRADDLTDCRNEVVRSVASKHDEVRLIELADWLCPQRQCRETIEGVEARPDGAHFSDGAAPTVVRWIVGQLRQQG